jgi:hypothetical protein
MLSETSGIAMFPPDRSVYGSPYFISDRRIFRKLAIGHNMRVFRSTWGAAFYKYANELLQAGGQIFIPTTDDDAKAVRLGTYSFRQLQEMFSQPGSYHREHSTAVFNAVPEISAGPSTLTRLVECSPWLINEEVGMRAIPDFVNMHRFDDIYLEFLLTGGEALVQRPRDWLKGEVDVRPPAWFESQVPADKRVSYGEAVSRALKSIAYLHCGIKYKMPIIRHIMKTHTKLGEGIAAIDFGAGCGTLTAELLLDPELKLSRGVAVDFNTSQTSQAGCLYRAFRDQFYGRFFYACKRMEEFTFDRKYELITALSSVLYAPHDKTLHIMDNFWENLAPGGVMILFELPKGDPNNKDYNAQFTSQEMERMMGKYGEVFRYSRTSLVPFSAKEAELTPVFRAVVKPS